MPNDYDVLIVGGGPAGLFPGLFQLGQVFAQFQLPAGQQGGFGQMFPQVAVPLTGPL